jgi:hypothetical protein
MAENIRQTLNEAVSARDIETIRNVLTTSMVQDPGFSSGVFEERLKRCLDSGISHSELFVPFEGAAISKDPQAWTKDYYAAQRTEFRYNFSLERLEHLKRIGRKLYPSALPYVQPQPASGTKRDKDSKPFPPPKDDFPKWLIPLGIGAAVIILLWVLLS